MCVPLCDLFWRHRKGPAGCGTSPQVCADDSGTRPRRRRVSPKRSHRGYAHRDHRTQIFRPGRGGGGPPVLLEGRVPDGLRREVIRTTESIPDLGTRSPGSRIPEFGILCGGGPSGLNWIRDPDVGEKLSSLSQRTPPPHPTDGERGRQSVRQLPGAAAPKRGGGAHTGFIFFGDTEWSGGGVAPPPRQGRCPADGIMSGGRNHVSGTPTRELWGAGCAYPYVIFFGDTERSERGVAPPPKACPHSGTRSPPSGVAKKIT